MKEKLLQQLANAAVDHGVPSCIPGPWCLNCSGRCVEDLPEELQEEARELWSEKAKELRAKKTA